MHLEIIQERLEREFNLDLVTTAPSVIYKVHKTNGEVIDLTNPSNLPDPSEIEYMEEPFVAAEIMVTSEYVGAIMKLCQERRGIYISMDYIEATRAVIKYDLPLNEIIYDFFDALKSRSRGYASFDYEMKGYVRSELVKLDILINREMVDALSFIVFKESAYERGRKMCERLKKEIPRHLFEIPIQASVGGKIIARETVKAMRKDVLAKCYGGTGTDQRNRRRTFRAGYREETFFFLGLRKMEGIDPGPYRAHYEKLLEKLQMQQLLEEKNGRISLTEYGIDISNYVLAQFLED